MNVLRNFKPAMSARRNIAAGAALILLSSACAATTEPVTLESLGLQVEVDIQAGTDFSLTVPLQEDTSISVASAPPGVEASIGEAPDGGSLLLSVSVDRDTPRGAYNLGLIVARNGDEHEVGWPFSVVEPVAGSTPESVRDLLILAIETRDVDSSRSLWPASSWEELGSEIVATFVPKTPEGDCTRTSDTGAHCFVFAQDLPFVLSLTMENQDTHGWAITVVGYDSTN